MTDATIATTTVNHDLVRAFLRATRRMADCNLPEPSAEDVARYAIHEFAPGDRATIRSGAAISLVGREATVIGVQSPRCDGMPRYLIELDGGGDSPRRIAPALALEPMTVIEREVRA